MASEEGFTLIELLIAVQILAILATMALPALLQTAERARVATAESNVDSAISASLAYYADTANNPVPYTYSGISAATLSIEAPGLSANLTAGAGTVWSTGDSFCLQDTEDNGDTYYRYEGGPTSTGLIEAGACDPAYAVA